MKNKLHFKTFHFLSFVSLQKIQKLKFTFTKQEKLTHKQQIANLFKHGKALKSFPIRALFLENELSYHRVLISVPKRRHKTAVARNRLKRLMREAYRKNKHQIKNNSTHFDLVLIYVAPQELSYKVVDTSIIKIIDKLANSKSPQ